MQAINTQKGIVLIMALLYLMLVTLLVAGAFMASILQSNMAIQIDNGSRAFQQAEAALLAGEMAIQGYEMQGQGGVEQGFYQFKKRPEEGCGFVYYQIEATGVFGAAKRMLQSVLLVPTLKDIECPEAVPLKLRLWWNMI